MKKLVLLGLVLFTLVGCNDKSSSTKDNKDVVAHQGFNIIESISTEKSWAYNVFDIQAVVDYNDVLFTVRIDEVEPLAKFMQKFDFPQTKVKATVNKSYKGKVHTQSIDIFYYGGVVTVADAINSTIPEAAEKNGWLDVKDKENTYIEYVFDEKINLVVGEEYVLSLVPSDSHGEIDVDNPVRYFLGEDAFGIFKLEKDSMTQTANTHLSLKGLKTNKITDVTID